MSEFDVLIVGAGSAGSVIAARASEDPNRTVCLIEAGPDYADITNTPHDLVNGHNNSYTAHDWKFKYHPTQGQEQPLPRGRVTGGSSAVNTTIALRSTPEDHAEWAALGNDEWAWDKVLPAYCRLERDLDYGAQPYHGDAGPISIRRYPVSELEAPQAAFLESARALDYPDCPDANDPNDWGSGPHPMNKLGRLRVSCAVGYLAPARIRPNLTIKANAHVRRVLIEKGRCVGVEYEHLDGSVATVRAGLVVLSAGAIMTPAILMRSGIGPRAQLESHGIDVLKDVAGVGENLSDHPALSVVCLAREGVTIDHTRPIIQTILRYTAPNSPKHLDLQIEQLSFAGRPNGPSMFAIAAVLEYQYGRGRLSLASADPHMAPIIENHFCEDERDLSRLAGCFEDTLAFTKVSPLAEMIDGVTFPDPKRGADRAAIEALCRRFSASGYHPCGTAKMGPREDDMAVVDQYGRSHHVGSLVVADASIMPSVPRANTNLSCIMIGEMIGEWIRTNPQRYET